VYTDTIAQKQFFEDVEKRVAALPGVQAAAVSGGLPAARQGFNGSPFEMEGQTYLKDQDHAFIRTTPITPDFFKTLSIPVLQGRAFTSEDRAGAVPVAVVTRAFADKFFKNANPIGKRVRLGMSKSTAPWLTIVGVVGNVFTGNQQEPLQPVLFQPVAQQRVQFAWISAKTAGPPLALTQSLRETVASVNPDIPLYWVQTVDAAASQSLWFVRVFGTMFMIFGFVALFLASVGLYAVMSFSVSRRTREVGIRMALGAQGRDVIGMIFGQGALQLGVGMVAGLGLAAAIAQVMSVVLFQVQPRDPVIFGGVATVLVAVGLLACLIPARRATLVDPLVALRSD
jgi:predicted permease